MPESAPPNDPWDGVSVWIRHAGRYPCQPAWQIAPYKSGHYCFFYIEQGRGWVDRDGSRLEARPGDLFVFRPGHTYAAGHDPKRPVTVLSIGFLLQRAGRVDALRSQALPERLELAAAERRAVVPTYERAVAAWASKTSTGRLDARGSILNLVAAVLNLIETLPAAHRAGLAEAPPGEQTRAAAVQSYVEAHLAEPLALKDLAGIAHLSPVYFAALFRKQTGQAPMEYVRRRRVEAARALLTESDESVERIAKRVGYDDPFYFSRLFRRMVGQAPSEYREAFKNPFLR
ncbi:MAG: AraC family transcriptional regulator [Planctomycetota bacterium]|nr:AraC family transcriptional regulator [Planctomycetota bacterium]